MAEERSAKAEKTRTIVVNGRAKSWGDSEISFDQVVKLAFETPPTGADMIFSITYRKGGNEHRPEGVMVEGDTIKVKEGTTFNVSATNRS